MPASDSFPFPYPFPIERSSSGTGTGTGTGTFSLMSDRDYCPSEGVESKIMRKAKWIVAVIAVVALVVLLRYTIFAPDIVEVRTAAAEMGLVEETVTNTRAGTVKVRLRAELSPQVGGLVVALPHREGDRVEAGEVIVVLDSRAQRAELASARTSVEAAEAQADEACLAAELAEKELSRVETLHARGIASDQNLDLLSTDRDRTRAGCAAGRAAVGQAESRVLRPRSSSSSPSCGRRLRARWPRSAPRSGSTSRRRRPGCRFLRWSTSSTRLRYTSAGRSTRWTRNA